MPTVCWEVWGYEKDEAPTSILLFKFPQKVGGDEDAQGAAFEAAMDVLAAGGSVIEVKRVMEGG